jgi:hypothetical protein
MIGLDMARRRRSGSASVPKEMNADLVSLRAYMSAIRNMKMVAREGTYQNYDLMTILANTADPRRQYQLSNFVPEIVEIIKVRVDRNEDELETRKSKSIERGSRTDRTSSAEPKCK